jgi:hypothetical protein
VIPGIVSLYTGQVIEGQSTLDALYKGYGDIPPFGKGPDQQKIHNQGNAYVRKNFPETDFILSCHLLDPAAEAAAAEKALREENERVAMQERLDAVLKAEDQDAGNGNEPEGGQQEQEGAGEERENDNDAVLDLTSEEAESVRAEVSTEYVRELSHGTLRFRTRMYLVLRVVPSELKNCSGIKTSGV